MIASSEKRTANPQAMAALFARRSEQTTGHPELRLEVDPDTWLTPRYILRELGGFDLDPCAALQNPEWIGASKAYTIHDDGLKQDWIGRVFMNPPFSQTARWIRRHAAHGLGISLVPASVESKVWRESVWPMAHAILLLHGRTRFANPDGSQTTGRPLRSIALIAWTVTDAIVLRNCELAGTLIEDWICR